MIRPPEDPTWCAQCVVADLEPLRLGVRGCRGWVHSIASSCVPCTYMAYLLSFLSYLAVSKSALRFRQSTRPSDPNTMTNTTLEATASSTGKSGGTASLSMPAPVLSSLPLIMFHLWFVWIPSIRTGPLLLTLLHFSIYPYSGGWPWLDAVEEDFAFVRTDSTPSSYFI